MFKELALNMPGIEIVPIILLCIAFIFFTVMVVYALQIDKNAIKRYAEMPLDTPASPSTHGENIDGKR